MKLQTQSPQVHSRLTLTIAFVFKYATFKDTSFFSDTFDYRYPKEELF